MKTMLGLILILGALAANATSKVNNGVMPSKTIWECTEKNAKTSPVYLLTEELDKTHLLTVMDGETGELFSSIPVTRDLSIQCFIPCDIFENKEQQVDFSVTYLPHGAVQKIESLSAGVTVAGQTTALTCTKPQ